MNKFRIDTFMSHYPSKGVDTYDEIYEPIKMDDDIPLSIIEVKIDNTSKNISVPRHWHRSIEIYCQYLVVHKFMKIKVIEKSIQVILRLLIRLVSMNLKEQMQIISTMDTRYRFHIHIYVI